MSFLKEHLRLGPKGNRTAYAYVHPAEPLMEIGSGFVSRAPQKTPYWEDTEHGHYGLIYVVSGQGTVTTSRGVKYKVGPGHAITIIPDQPAVLIEPDGRRPWIEAFMVLDFLAMDRLATLSRIDLVKPVFFPGPRKSLVRGIAKLTDALTDCPSDRGPALLLRAQMLVLRMHRYDARRLVATQDPGMVERARVLLDKDLDKHIDQAQIAQALGVDYHHYRRLFTLATGISPGQYRIQRRIALARRMLGQQRMSVHEVAQALGYADAFVFSRQFKRFTGRTPSQMRRQQ